MLEVKGLAKKFKQNSILENIDFEAQPGSITVIQGNNGSGKTTLLKCLAGMLSFETGNLYFESKKLSPQETHWKEMIGFAPNTEGSFFPQLSLLQNIHFFSSLFQHKKKSEELFELFEMKPWIHKSYQTCSSGIKKRMAIIRALSHSPKLLFLDEPFSNIDLNFTKKMEEIISEITYKEKLVTLITTNKETSIGDKIIYLNGEKNG